MSIKPRLKLKGEYAEVVKKRSSYALFGLKHMGELAPWLITLLSLTDPIEIHKQRLNLWFSHLPQEEKQFGGYFTPETMHIDPLILERKPAESRGIDRSQIPHHPSLSVEQLFDRPPGHPSERGMNIMLYGAVGTGKSTVVRKLVLDWCAGTALSQFKLLVPFSCEDLSQSKNPTSLCDLVGRKYLHLRRTPFLSGEAQQARDVLFIFNGMERMRLNFRIASTELCSDPNEALPTGTLMVNLLRKYLLPEVGRGLLNSVCNLTALGLA